MRIGFFTDGFLPQPHGVTTSVLESAKELERRGHEVYIIAPKYPGYVDRNKKVIRLTSLKVHKTPETRISLNLPDKALRKIMSMDFDIIHGHSGGPTTLLGWEVARAKKIPFVVTYHTLWNRYTHYFLKGKVVGPRVMERATKIFGNQTDFLIAPTGRVEKELRSYGVKKPVEVVPSGIDVEAFKNEEKGFLREKIKNQKDPIILFVGRLGREKSVDFLIRSFKYVHDNLPSTQFVIVGDGVDRKKLENLASKLKVLSNIHFLGHIDMSLMRKVYKDAEVFVFSSTTETQGLVVPEALASGVPVVAVDDPAFECIESGKNGYLVEKDPKEFALKTLSILENKDLRKQMGQYAFESAQTFSVKNTVDSLENVYFEVLDKYNKESVGKIMGSNARGERAFLVNISFFLTVISSRLLSLFFHTQTYPQVILGNQIFPHASFGLFLILIFLALLVRKRTPGFFPLAILGVGIGLIANEAWSLLSYHTNYLDYWNPLNLIPILAAGILPIILFNTRTKDRPKFYISTRELKHENPENPKVSVVVPAYNESEFIEPTLKSLLNQTYKNFEIIVVDNNSTDNTGEVARRFGAKVLREHVAGVSATRQAGFFAAKGEIIVSTDADTVVPENWIARIVEEYEKNKNLSGFGGLNLLYSGPLTARTAGRFISPLFWRFDKLVAGGWNLIGFNMSARKSAFLKIGGFDPTLKMGEDIDLSQKLRKVGEVKIDTGLLVYSSGRRYSSGLLTGLMSYVPFWISKILLKQDKPFEFKAVRTEKLPSGKFALLPLGILIVFLATLFYVANSQIQDKIKLF